MGASRYVSREKAPAIERIARENHGTDHTQSCLTAKPPMHHRRVQMWLWRLVAAGGKTRPFGLPGYNPPLSTSSTTTGTRWLLLWAGFRLDAFYPYSPYPR